MHLPKSYDPKKAEESYYKLWSDGGYFRPETNPSGKPYSIVIPPPNVTGSLHMGHALNATLQDILCRWMRMSGRKALWLPGTDHAGIATQNVVERKLQKEGKDRHMLGREAFIEEVWKWKEEYGGRIIHQLKKLGTSCDWSRERFTFDEGLSKAVREVFVRLYEKGLIFRDTRLINWCPRCRTALSDLEVEHEDQQGTLTFIKYPYTDGTGYITVATTRPETMLGDAAVSVNPKDPRYTQSIGKSLFLPLTQKRIPVISDDTVDMEFGTGAVKITPAHDFNDEAIAKRQNPPLKPITVIGETGAMTSNSGIKYEGMDRYECRKLVVEDLKLEGLLVRQEPHMHSIGHCYRCKTVVEPYATPQWFVRTGPLAKRAMDAVREKKIRILPPGWENSYFSWMENIRDWCITRQIWWGHRVPVWYCGKCRETIVSRNTPELCTKCGSADITQDPDVLDTWFSSALWPFSTLGWPDNTQDLRDFYPTSVLVTAFDILFFWVARMIMMGLEFMDEVPFIDVYIHALIRDSEGQKMSKSKGNVIDPLLIIDKYGADAFRFTLSAFAAQGRDIKFDEQRVEGYRHFINKLWNASRFIFMNLEQDKTYEFQHPKAETTGQRWILSRLAQTADDINSSLTDYRFNDAANAAYQFAWHELCDWYIEIAKTEMTDNTRHCLLYVLDGMLKLLHPFMPFITEDIWQAMPVSKDSETIMVSKYPADMPKDPEAEAAMGYVIDAISGIRNIRGEMNIQPAEVIEASIKTSSTSCLNALKGNIHYVEKLSRSTVVELGEHAEKPQGASTSVKKEMEIYVSLSGIDMSAELDRLRKERARLQETVSFIEGKLQNPDFSGRAPAHVVEKEKHRLDEAKDKLGRVLESMRAIDSAIT